MTQRAVFWTVNPQSRRGILRTLPVLADEQPVEAEVFPGVHPIPIYRQIVTCENAKIVLLCSSRFGRRRKRHVFG
jgi:hypothetical protein